MCKKRTTKISWQTPVFQSISCFLASFCWFCPYFCTGSSESHTEEDAIYGRHKTVPNSDTVSSKLHFFKEDVKGEIEQKAHSWGLTVEGEQVWASPLKCPWPLFIDVQRVPTLYCGYQGEGLQYVFLSDKREIRYLEE